MKIQVQTKREPFKLFYFLNDFALETFPHIIVENRILRLIFLNVRLI